MNSPRHRVAQGAFDFLQLHDTSHVSVSRGDGVPSDNRNKRRGNDAYRVTECFCIIIAAGGNAEDEQQIRAQHVWLDGVRRRVALSEHVEAEHELLLWGFIWVCDHAVVEAVSGHVTSLRCKPLPHGRTGSSMQAHGSR